MQRFAGIVAAAVVSALAAHAADDWVRLTTSHFELLTTAGEKKGREAILCFETVRQFFADYGIGRAAPGRVRIVGFRNEQEFRPYAPSEFAAAFYSGGDAGDYIVLSRTGAESFPVAVHEYLHLLTHHGPRELPVWLNEGLAEVFSTLRPAGSRVIVGETMPANLEELRRSRPIELETLLTAGRDSRFYTERAPADLFYAESWALVHMLFTSHEYRPRFRAFLEAVQSGQNAAAAIRHVYGKSVTDIERDLASYVSGGRYRAAVVGVRLERAAEAVKAEPMKAWDAELALAQLLASTKRQTETGKKMLEQLMAEQPQRPETPALLGEMALREGRRDDAIGLLARASQLGIGDAGVYFRYAMLRWSRSGDGDKEVREELRKALALQPDFAEARLRLGFALMDHGEYREALGELTKVKDLPQNDAFWYYHGMGYAHYRLDEYEEARAAMEKARKWARGATQQTALEHLDSAVATAEADAKANAEIIAAAHLPKMEGRLKQVECAGTKVRLELLTGGQPVWFFIDDPSAVRMTNAGSITTEFVCGEQEGRPVVIEYLAQSDAATDTIGLVRGIQFE
ncbi:MAG TPA: DUF1570 domain-containing protein [Bryobacteraceae bacterium]|nr:DUF1570 domain-containing protein [Bryobacteraceae bacterium]